MKKKTPKQALPILEKMQVDVLELIEAYKDEFTPAEFFYSLIAFLYLESSNYCLNYADFKNNVEALHETILLVAKPYFDERDKDEPK